jgi:hypothetical protein
VKRLLVLAAILTGMAAPAAAQLSAAAEAPNRPAVEIADFAKKVERTLAERGAVVGIVARIGRDPKSLPEGLTYTHVGFWVYSQIPIKDGRTVPGYVSYNLYQSDDDPGRSDLKQDFPTDFFADVYTLQAGVIVPTPEVQRRLLAVITSPTYARLHNPRYSVVASPTTPEYQNCTEFVLDVMLAGLYRTEDQARIQADLAAYFEPQTIRLGGFREALGTMFVRGFATSDHRGAIRTATFETIARFMQRYRLADAVLTVDAR